jgi:acylphosphatase
MITIRLVITGKVQGVFYRKSAKEKGCELKITGMVKNIAGGEVEIIASGTKEQLDNFIAWCKVGPPKAVVTKIQIQEQPFQPFSGFLIIK